MNTNNNLHPTCALLSAPWHGFALAGESFPLALQGEFAIAIFDFESQKAVFATDVFGTKPLWYSLSFRRLARCSRLRGGRLARLILAQGRLLQFMSHRCLRNMQGALNNTSSNIIQCTAYELQDIEGNVKWLSARKAEVGSGLLQERPSAARLPQPGHPYGGSAGRSAGREAANTVHWIWLLG